MILILLNFIISGNVVYPYYTQLVAELLFLFLHVLVRCHMMFT